MAGSRPRPLPRDNTKKVRVCVDCVAEGITTKRKTPHPGPRCVTHHRARRNQRKSFTQEQRWLAVYGISAEEYHLIKDSQNGVCAICNRASGLKKALSVDHCHATGVVRGLLCSPCNRNVLGHLRDSEEALQRAIDYLRYPPAVHAIGVKITPDVALTLNGD